MHRAFAHVDGLGESPLVQSAISLALAVMSGVVVRISASH
jgi:hypothetical protein